MKLTNEQIAKVVHEANRAYCEVLGDKSQVAWSWAPTWQQESAIEGVSVLIADPSMTPEEQHKAWMGRKVAEGWVYGEQKDATKKTHPALLPYHQLSEEQQIKDYLFQGIVRALARLPKGYVTA